jgi:hypothetical protein
MRKRTRDGYRLSDGSVVKTGSIALDPRNVNDLSKATLVRRLAYKRIRDPDVLFAPQNTRILQEELPPAFVGSMRQMVKER